jgi:putative SOS response-associated peptidase YedK
MAMPAEMSPRYNIAPTQLVAVIANNGKNMLEFYRWGLIPSWAKDSKAGSRMINARAETLAEKPAFRTAFKRRRCLIPADGFYEWRLPAKNADAPGRKTKTPIYLRLKSGEPFAFAGLWETWQPEGGEPVLSCTIITTTPNSLVEKIHDRMPVILKPEAYEQWLAQGEQAPEKLARLLKPYPASGMTAYAVSPLVNSPAVDTPEIIRPL